MAQSAVKEKAHDGAAVDNASSSKGPNMSSERRAQLTASPVGSDGEQPVREQLKKASIAGLPKYGLTEDYEHDGGDERKVDVDKPGTQDCVMQEVPKSSAQDFAMLEVPKGGEISTGVESSTAEKKGRFQGKRLRDEQETGENSKEGGVGDPLTPSLGGHTRKKSRDVRSGQPHQPDEYQPKLASTLREVDEQSEMDDTEPSTSQDDEPSHAKQGKAESSTNGESNVLDHDRMSIAASSPQKTRDTAADEALEMPDTEPPTDQEDEAAGVERAADVGDHDMTSGTASPKKKRSREEVDSSQSQPVQKMVATEETRRRRSSEEEGGERPVFGKVLDKPRAISAANGHAVKGVAVGGDGKSTPPTSKIPPGSGFANASAASPFASLGKSVASSSNSLFGQTISSSTALPSKPTFASSGFGALSGSTIFGSGASKMANPLSTPSSSPFGTLAGDKAADKPKLSFGNAGSSTFGTTTFGGAAYGGGFGNAGAFGGGSKLSSFAAPIGDTKLGSSKPAKAFGEESDEEGSGGGSDGEDEADSSAAPTFSTQDKPDPKYTIAAGKLDTGEEHEDTLYTNRGKLFQFDAGTWVERGVGPIKLNVTRIEESSGDDDYDDDDEESGHALRPGKGDDHSNEKTVDAAATEKTERNRRKGAEVDAPKVRARLLMRAAATHKVILNAPIFREMKIEMDSVRRTIKFSVPLEGKLVPFQLKMGKEDDLRALFDGVLFMQQRIQYE